MCLLSVYSPGALVNVDHLQAGADNNPDGYGFAIIAGDRIETGHGMDSYAVIDAFDRVRLAHPDSWALFHSRFTTDGLTSEDNCHPFIVGGDERTILAHNGVLPQDARPGKRDPRSDTRILAEDLIPGGRFGNIHRSRGRRRLSKWMHKDGYPNKIAILTVDPAFQENAYILGESLGHWESGVWHSNTDYIPWKPLRRSLRPPASAENDPYGAYINGDITFSAYLDYKYGPKQRDTNQCYFCPEGRSNLDLVYGYCRTCQTCLDCLDDISVCDCWVPASKRTGKSKDRELTAATIDTALASLPADQAAQVRDVLRDQP